MKKDLTSDQLLTVPPLLWGGMFLSPLAMGAAGYHFRGAAGGGGLVPFLLPLFLLLLLAGLLLLGWVRRQLSDDRIFPRVMDARGRLGGEVDSGIALLQLRLALSLTGWAVSDAMAFLGALLSLLSGEGWPALLFGSAGILTLLLAFPRRGEAAAQLARWQAALSAKSFAASMGCAGCSPD